MFAGETALASSCPPRQLAPLCLSAVALFGTPHPVRCRARAGLARGARVDLLKHGLQLIAVLNGIGEAVSGGELLLAPLLGPCAPFESAAQYMHGSTFGGAFRHGRLTPVPCASSQAAADSMTPVAGYYIREHFLRQPEEAHEQEQAVYDGEAPWVSDYY